MINKSIKLEVGMILYCDKYTYVCKIINIDESYIHFKYIIRNNKPFYTATINSAPISSIKRYFTIMNELEIQLYT